ncbi:MAG: type I-E CRISPR-associated protein Cse1/CasA [Magnetococcales bacterium]|nr:type I-E CRISPR-associated protein Cse1/CasA [Magnetococcales bacterium]MBF0322343.1 type I-E CRISPR-associated protein Cse1/CasA [Magnetococcales bacterium]
MKQEETMDNNLLTDAIFRIDTATGTRDKRSLPGVLAGLTNDEIIAFVALQPYQAHAWHAFLVQLAAMALHRKGLATPPTTEAHWRDLLRTLTPDWPQDEPWQLVVKDLSKPAFMQPPVPEKMLQGFKNQCAQPDRIDVLVTAKNHDIKMARMGHAHPDNWVMALVSLQTMEGFMGAGNYGIARMNGGFASRPGVGVRPDPACAAHFRQDLDLLRKNRGLLLDQYPDLYRKTDGISLLWLVPWDGQTTLPLTDLDPYFIEVCRRARLASAPSGVIASISTSKTTRIQAKDFKGVLGDPWTPIKNDKENTSLTITGKGFDYATAAKLLLGDEHYRPSPAQTQDIKTQHREIEFFARAMARGQGVSEGYHERRIPIPAPARVVLGRQQERAKLAEMANQRIQQCGTMANKVLKPALLTMIQEAPEKLNFKDRRADPWLVHLDQRVDDTFFPALWRSLAMTPEDAQADWLNFLRQTSLEIMESAKRTLIGGGARRYKTFVAAERTFFGSLNKQFELFQKQPGQAKHEENT